MRESRWYDFAAGVLILAAVTVIGVVSSPKEEPALVVAPRVVGTASAQAVHPWYSGYRIGHKTICVELQGSSTLWPWTSVLVEWNKAGLRSYGRTTGGCASVPDDRKVIVKTWTNNSPTSSCGEARSWLVGDISVKNEIWLNLTRATPGHIACRTGAAFSSVITHEFGHVLGLSHNTTPGSAMSNDTRIAQPVDLERVRYIHQNTPW